MKNFLPFEKAREIVRKYGIDSSEEYRLLVKNKTLFLPYNPNTVYKNKWVSWYDWLGTKRKHLSAEEFLPFEKARDYVRNLKLQTSPKWKLFCLSGNRPCNIPSNPCRIYKNKGWRGFSDWLGTNKKWKLDPWPSINDAKEIVRNIVKENNIEGREDWYVYCKGVNKPINIPTGPHLVYKNNGWKGWQDWLGKRTGRKYRVNEKYFKKWTRNMAYVLGLWFADGCIHRQEYGYVFDIGLKKGDEDILLLILKDMKSEHRLYTCGNSYRLAIGCNAIVRDIIRLGGKTRKSLDVKFPYVPNKFISDFIRGYFDGDGSYYIIGHKTKRLGVNIVSGSKHFMLTLKKFWKSIFGIYIQTLV